MYIRLNTITIFAHHGVYAEEIRDGNHFEIDLEVEIPDVQTSNDDLAGTLDYSELYKTVISVSEGRRYNLIETFASDICWRILEAFSQAESVRVKVRKLDPPVGGEVKNVEVELFNRRSNA